MKLRNLAFYFGIPAFLYCSTLHAQTPHAPVSAGSIIEMEHNPGADSLRYKAAREKDRENIRKALKQSRENLDAVAKPKEELREKKLWAKIASYAVFGILALLFYIRKRKKTKNQNEDTGNV